jgi:hypothetical protein
MTRWQATLDVRELWEQGKTRTITAHQLAQGLAKKIREVGLSDGFGDIDRITNKLDEFPKHGTFDDFDNIYDQLCNWADFNNRLWIQTF